ncbi:metal-dependent hydrolase family protein [Pseudohaliea rubra]|uniref:Xaa-Pro dipeptidase family enzyme n=1 Tax=Pseudohaliea rubra DSM 19751 TaxID=1265313 RepID=A0A095VS38_9GAMM|nr:amidohydrolase family protein [Pseudohaliea rubra]KGE03913.1 Xaa-Pro dipeptidase family enzyme [Pseudohaliea rubra DSM 19751]
MNETILIENGTILDGNGAPPVQGSVLIRGGKIVAVGAGAGPGPGPEAVRRIDATGQTVMPGLIDAHCHLSFDDAGSNAEIFHQRRDALSALVAAYNAKKLLRAGVTGFLDPDSTFENMLDLRDAIEAGVTAGPRMACGAYALITGVGGTAGRLIADEGVTGYYKVVNSRDEIVREVRRQVKIGVDWIKVHVTGIIPRQAQRGEVCVWTADELKLLCDTAHDLNTPVMGHCRGADATKLAAETGFDLIFHATGMDDAALQAVIDRKVPLAPAFTLQANIVDYGDRLGTDRELVALFEREITDSADTIKAAYRAGVPLLCGSESGFSLVPYGDWHWKELEVFVRYFDMSPLEAIRCATAEGARALRMEGRVGQLTPGFEADILCVQGRVDRDLSLLGDSDNIRRVFLAGVEQDLTPLPPRKPIPGWRLAGMGSMLTREVALRGPQAEPFTVEELH